MLHNYHTTAINTEVYFSFTYGLSVSLIVYASLKCHMQVRCFSTLRSINGKSFLIYTTNHLDDLHVHVITQWLCSFTAIN